MQRLIICVWKHGKYRYERTIGLEGFRAFGVVFKSAREHISFLPNEFPRPSQLVSSTWRILILFCASCLAQFLILSRTVREGVNEASQKRGRHGNQ